VLDQCLSFGEGILTAARVRQALGLIGDEAYGELLTAVADRQPGAVFAVITRVSDSGADLAEFAGGLAELLRAVVMSQFGAEPEGLPESTRRLIAALAPRFAPEDAVRMLKLLGEAEQGIRRSANPRIALETLLLRWSMLDRAVDLRAVLAGGMPLPAVVAKPIPETVAGSREPAPRAKSAPEGLSAQTEAPAARSSAASGLTAHGSASAGAGLTEEALAATWPDIIAAATRQSPMLGQALGHASPTLAGSGMVELRFGPDSALFQDGATRQQATVETILGATFGTAVKVMVVGGNAGVSPERKSKRLSAEEIRRERLDQLRGKDPALDAAVNALDLELVDDD